MVRCVRFSAQVEQIDAHEDDEEAADEADAVSRPSRTHALEEDEGGKDGGGGEEDVVDGVDDVCREGLQSLVEVVHPGETRWRQHDPVQQRRSGAGSLNHNRTSDSSTKKISRRVGELIVSSEGELDSDAEALQRWRKLSVSACFEDPTWSCRTLIAITLMDPTTEHTER